MESRRETDEEMLLLLDGEKRLEFAGRKHCFL